MACESDGCVRNACFASLPPSKAPTVRSDTTDRTTGAPPRGYRGRGMRRGWLAADSAADLQQCARVIRLESWTWVQGAARGGGGGGYAVCVAPRDIASEVSMFASIDLGPCALAKCPPPPHTRIPLREGRCEFLLRDESIAPPPLSPCLSTVHCALCTWCRIQGCAGGQGGRTGVRRAVTGGWKSRRGTKTGGC